MSLLYYNEVLNLSFDEFSILKPIAMRDYFPYVKEGMVLEFGVAHGGTLASIMGATNAKIYGFDTFEGLPEDWALANGAPIHVKGAFKACPPTDLPSNVEMVIGLFQDTLPKFLEEHPEPIAFVHMDCDLYSSHKFVFDHIKDRLDGTVLVFDDLLGYEHNRQHGFKAFKELFDETDYAVKYLGHHNPPPGVGFLFSTPIER